MTRDFDDDEAGNDRSDDRDCLANDETAVAHSVVDLRDGHDDFDDDETTVASTVGSQVLGKSGSSQGRSKSVPPKVTISLPSAAPDHAATSSLRDRNPKDSEPWLPPAVDQATGSGERVSNEPSRFRLLGALVVMLIVAAVFVYALWPAASSDVDLDNSEIPAASLEAE